jgi:ERCC4-related helicase
MLPADFLDLEPSEIALSRMSATPQTTDYHAKYLAHLLLKRGGSDKMERLAGTMRDAKIELTPHQVEAALFAFRSPLSKGVILADEVGLGKTIEAGLVISQKWAERKRRILIIVPANLRKQWNQELLDKFYLPSMILEAKSFKESEAAGNRNPFIQDEIVICSYQFASRQYETLMTVKWDLVVIDEAHKLRNVYKASSRISNNLKIALKNAPKVLLTATPLQNSLLELYGLVSFIDEFHFGDKKSFTTQYSKISNDDQFDELRRRLKPVCHRTLRKEVLEYVSYTNRRCVTQDFYPGDEEQRLYEEVSEYLWDPDIQALPPSQRSLMILVMRKLLASSTYAIAGALDSLARKLNRRLKESDTAEEELLEERGLEDDFDGLEDLIDEWGEDEESAVLTQANREAIEAEVEKLERFRDLAVSITENAKGEKLLTALEKGFTMARSLGAAEKAIIFTESRRTQDYLLRILQETHLKDQIVLFNGSNTDPLSRDIYNEWLEKHRNTDKVTGSRTADMRSALVDYFRNEAKIMIATEAGAEGINLQFCSMIVNYDLPWNPQRIEQRIGRCHRFGQKHDVVVVNFLNKRNAADERVYDLLADKLKLFEGVFGASDEVLGAIESGVDFEKRIVNIYQNCRKGEQIEIEFETLQKECREKIDETFSKTHKKLLDNFDDEVQEKLRFNKVQSKKYVDRVTESLGRVSRHILSDVASFNDSATEFTLNANPFHPKPIPKGRYSLTQDEEESHYYRLGHPLAELVLMSAAKKSLPAARLDFDLSAYKSSVAALEPLRGKEGWITLHRLKISSLDDQEFLCFTGFTLDGDRLSEDQCQRLFNLGGEVVETELTTDAKAGLEALWHENKQNILNTIESANLAYINEEDEKLELWADDKAKSLRLSLKEIEDAIKEQKKLSRQCANTAEKLKIMMQIRSLEDKRDEAWKDYEDAKKEINTKKDDLLDEISARLEQKEEVEELFTIKWRVL